MTPDLFWDVTLVVIALLMGGILKGATGAGAPILAVPVLVLLFDVHFAIVVMLVPNLVTNLMQTIRFFEHLPERRFVIPLLLGGVIGVVAGTYVLTLFSSQILSLFVAISVLAYIALRLARPDWSLSFSMARKLSVPAGLAAGFLQGASGLSAPVSITFLNAMRLPRPTFIAMISLFFVTFTSIQIIALFTGGLLQWRDLPISAFALLPILAGMPLGAKLAQKLKPEIFDRLILALLALIAVRLLAGIFI